MTLGSLIFSNMFSNMILTATYARTMVPIQKKMPSKAELPRQKDIKVKNSALILPLSSSILHQYL